MRPIDIRERLVRALEADLVGPFEDGAPEILELPPSRWYSTGFLAPRGGRGLDPDDGGDDELAAGSESAAEDAGSADPPSKRHARFPASMGLSVLLPAAPDDPAELPDRLVAEVRYADYRLVELDRGAGWERLARGPVAVNVPLDRRVLEAAGVPVPGSDGLRLSGQLRATTLDGLPDGARILSLFLVNERPPRKRDRDLAFAFQVGMTLRYERGFLARPNRRGEDSDDADQRVRALQFRDQVEWAVGHNTSVERPDDTFSGPDGEPRAKRLTTTQLPRFEVRAVKHRAIDGLITRMDELGSLDPVGLERGLMPLCDSYGAWIDEMRRRPLDRPAQERVRDALVAEAERARGRIRAGVELVARDAAVGEAFRRANQAMHAAAMRADRAREDKRYTGDEKPAWRPFQLAFVLMNLPAVALADHPDRAVADLIYFPTGGGKTEAYLGLIAFTLLYRRMRSTAGGEPGGGRGVAVILRYTLRLLTLDQLGRAATLMCALELMRKREPKLLGSARMSVGLWVGQSATANRLAEVHQALHDYSRDADESPFPLTRCPWCNADIAIENVKLVDDRGQPVKTGYTRAVVSCRAGDCAFNEKRSAGHGLPVLFVDEQIYRELPEFLVATVDKFAMMPWRGEAGMLFGRVTHIDQRRAYGVMHRPPRDAMALPGGLRPPELIVQDELHLISGPLGTMVGLYEAAVDCLCEAAGRGPKVVCSTATARRAQDQIRALFDRDMALFPPRGVDADDNFFAAADAEKPGRLYVGVAAPGRALRAVSVRTYALLLAAAQTHFDERGAPDQPADPYMTLVGYFNSLRELGGMRRLVEDEVTNRVARFSEKRPHGAAAPHPWAADRAVRLPAELTSRESTERVKDTKQRLAARLAAAGAAAGAGSAAGGAVEPLDVVLASSMISVGLDIDRLGLMVVTGQPKTTSEYIQATSRVGRAYPGLVVTCLNTMRPRDRSHYERFVAYHESFYRDVEAASVTPFSGQALDRGLVATLLSMIRHGVGDMQPPAGANELHDHRAGAEALLEWLGARARRHRQWHDREAEDRLADVVRRRGKNFLDAWERVIARARKGGAGRTYSRLDGAGAQGKALLFSATDDRPAELDDQRFEAPTSMRDVEPGVHVWLRYQNLDRRM